jgi:putative ABC transport system ATP-binding protein/lipoprotein-releasing system ATP-binding protein
MGESSMTEILIKAENVGRTYQRGETAVVALASATCRVVPGDRIALMGPSGSGKSTLLYLMGGLDTPTSGTIVWPSLGSRATLRPAKIAFVFQMPSLLAPLTVVENVELPLLLGRKPTDLARKAAIEMLEQLGLSAIANKLPEELSGGQAQRVAIARALASRPQLILADEPTGQLDHPTAKLLFDVLLATLAGTNTALVVATHDRTVAERLDSLWSMEHGILLERE